MITHTFFDKCNTIIEGSENNTGLNPVAELNVGDTLTRILISFDLTRLKEQVINGEIDVERIISDLPTDKPIEMDLRQLSPILPNRVLLITKEDLDIFLKMIY